MSAAGAWVMGAVTALFPLGIVTSRYKLPLAAVLIVYAGSAVILAFAWRLYFERPEELDKKIPISSQELRRRRKEFFDSLGPPSHH